MFTAWSEIKYLATKELLPCHYQTWYVSKRCNWLKFFSGKQCDQMLEFNVTQNFPKVAKK